MKNPRTIPLVCTCTGNNPTWVRGGGSLPMNTRWKQQLSRTMLCLATVVAADILFETKEINMF